MDLDSREQALAFELVETLGSSLDLAQVMPRAQGVLSQLLSADYVALCVSRPGGPTAYDWLVAEMPPAFFAHYEEEMAAEDFVLQSVILDPNTVKRDSEMVTREVLERSLLYRRCRELGMPLEHVMAVMLDVKQDWHGGLTLYRERPRPFSDRDRALLQWLAPFVARTVRNCRAFGEAALARHVLDALFHQPLALLVLTPPSREEMRTPHVTSLLEKWFTPSERAPTGLPQVLMDRLAALASPGAAVSVGKDTWVRSLGPDQRLKVMFVQLPPERGQRSWALLFQEMSRVIPVPSAWSPGHSSLSGREVEVVDCALRNWSKELIASHLKLSTHTVKTHLRNIFEKLDVDDRADLLFQAALLRDLP